MTLSEKREGDEETGLESVLRSALAFLGRQNLRVFWGSVSAPDELPHAEWDTALEPDVEKFLECAKGSGAELVFLSYTKCKLEVLGEGGSESQPGESMDRLENIRPHEGKIAEISLAWIRDRTMFEYTRTASWANDYFEILDLDMEDPDEDALSQDKEPQFSEEEVGLAAMTLASDSRFQAARSRAQHLYAARRVLDHAVVANPEMLAAVIEDAKSIFEIEIKPTKELELAEQVEALRQSGLTKAQIAQKLKISANRMKRMF